MNLWLLYFSCLIDPSLAGAQNLVPNSSFEEFSECPKDLGKRQPAFARWLPANSIPIDYFHICSDKCGVPENAVGNQQAKSGNAYIGLTLFNEKYRSYAEVELTQPLTAGMKYTVEFSVCLAEKSKYSIGNIAAYLTTQKLISKSADVIEIYEFIDAKGGASFISGLCRPQVKNGASGFISDVNEWTTITATFKARGGERFLTIGNFVTTPGTPMMEVNGKNNYAYYYLDDVAVYQSGTAPEVFASTLIMPEKGIQRNETVKKEEVSSSKQLAVNNEKSKVESSKSKETDEAAIAKKSKVESEKSKEADEEAIEAALAKADNKPEKTTTQNSKLKTQNSEQDEAAIEAALAAADNKPEETITQNSKLKTQNLEQDEAIIEAALAKADRLKTVEAEIEAALAAADKNNSQVKSEPAALGTTKPEGYVKEGKPTILRQLYFERNSTNILPESEEELMLLAEIMEARPDIIIELAGHTDETGTEDGNKILSMQRSQAVARFMLLLEIPSSRFVCKGYGSSRPLFNNDSEEGREKNRRVEFTVLTK